MEPKRLLLLLSFMAVTLAPVQLAAQKGGQISGAWNKTSKNGLTEILLFAGNYFSMTSYSYEGEPFLLTMGGSFKWQGDQLVFTYEFHTGDSTLVGTQESFKALLKKKNLEITAPGMQASRWAPLDAGKSTALTAAWLFSGRKNDNGEITRRDTNVPRKTMKILTGSRFQWIAYNSETGQFFGTGGGTYTAENGTYTEKIEFFSRDPKRVGAELKFDFRVEGKDWHHSGLNSSGQPLYEIWSTR